MFPFFLDKPIKTFFALCTHNYMTVYAHGTLQLCCNRLVPDSSYPSIVCYYSTGEDTGASTTTAAGRYLSPKIMHFPQIRTMVSGTFLSCACMMQKLFDSKQTLYCSVTEFDGYFQLYQKCLG